MSLLLLRILLAFSLLLISEASEVDSEHYDDGSGNEQDAGEFFPKESQYRYASFLNQYSISRSEMIV